MGWGKKIKKAVKKIGRVVKKAWKGVVGLVETVAKVIVDALKFVWKEIIMPILEFIANLLGFKDKEIVQVSANTQPLFEEDKAWLFNDNIILRSLIQDTDVVDEMRHTILYGEHNDVRGYHKYGESKYSRGLPQITLAAGRTTNADASTLSMWQIHCNTYGYSNPFTTVASLPIRDGRFDIVTTDPLDLLETALVTNYNYDVAAKTIVVEGTEYLVNWDNLDYEYALTAEDPDWEEDGTGDPADKNDIYELSWAVTIASTRKYVTGADVSITGSVLSGPLIINGEYVVGGQGMGNMLSLDLASLDAGLFPLAITYSEPVLYSTVKEWTVTRETETVVIEGEEEEIITFTIEASAYESDPENTPKELLMNGTVDDALMPSFQYSFYVTNPAYTPYPNDLGFQFKYTVAQESTTDADFTGGGADDSTFANYSEDYMDALPVVILKEEGVWRDSNKNSPEYITGNKLLEKVGMQMQPLIDSIRGSDGGADKELLTAVVRLGVDMLSKNQGCRAYIFEFLNFIHATTISSEADYNASNTGSVQGTKTNNITLSEGSFHTTYQYSFSRRSVVSGLTAKRNGFFSTSWTNSDFTIIRHNGDGTGVELFFKNLAGAYVISVPEAKKASMAAMSFTESDDPDYTSNFVLPIMVGPYKGIRSLQREEVITRSKYLTVTSGTYTKLRWYKDPKFLKTVGIVIIIVTTVLSFGTATAPVAAGVSAAIAVLTTLAVNFAIQLVIAYIKTRVLALIFEKIAKALGNNDFAQIVAAIATAATAYYTGMVADFSSLVLETTKAASTFMNGEIGKELKQLEQDKRSFSDRVSALSREHSEAMESMTIKNVLGLSGLHTYKAESPELFFSRAELDTTEILTTFDAFVGLDLNLDYMTS